MEGGGGGGRKDDGNEEIKGEIKGGRERRKEVSGKKGKEAGIEEPQRGEK